MEIKNENQNENQNRELNSQNENQKPKPNLSLSDIFRIQNEICNSVKDCDVGCPFRTKDNACMICSVDNLIEHADEVERICMEWEMTQPTLLDKVNEIINPYGLKLYGSTIRKITTDAHGAVLLTTDYGVDEILNTKYKEIK